jgi:hypothetical protein
MARVTPPDLEQWLCDYLRAVLAGEGTPVEVSNKEPGDLTAPLDSPLIVVRDDSGPRISAVTFDRMVGVSVLWGSREDDQPTADLARRILAILSDDAIATLDGSPIAAVDWDGCNGPYAVPDDQPVARQYLAVHYIVVGIW